MRDLTLVFDLDGTLVDTAPDLITATNHVLAAKGLAPVDGALLRPMISRGARAMILAALNEHAVVPPQPDEDELLARFLTFYAANIAATSRPFPGAAELLSRLHGAGAHIAVCTNKTEDLSKRLLQALDLMSAIDFVAGRDTLKVHKPHRGHLIGAIQKAGGQPDRAIMIGDSDTDIDTAIAAGVPVIGVTFGYADPPMRALKPTVMIDSYDEFDDAVAEIVATLS